jgi:hypothetical protein
MTETQREECYTCKFHEGGWEHCRGIICNPEFHTYRCTPNKLGHCIFYKPKEGGKK